MNKTIVGKIENTQLRTGRHLMAFGATTFKEFVLEFGVLVFCLEIDQWGNSLACRPDCDGRDSLLDMYAGLRVCSVVYN